jgi:hypothetical protein
VTTELGDEPLLSIFSSDSLLKTNVIAATLALRNTETRARENDVEIHTIDTDGGIVFETEIDVFVDTEAEVTTGREALIGEFEFLDGETLLEDFFGLITSDSDVGSDLFVTTNGESTNSETSSGKDGGLLSEFFKNLLDIR